MDFELPEDIRLMRETVRKYVDRELIPIENGKHGMSQWHDASMQHWKGEMIAWLQKTLKIRKPQTSSE